MDNMRVAAELVRLAKGLSGNSGSKKAYSSVDLKPENASSQLGLILLDLERECEKMIKYATRSDGRDSEYARKWMKYKDIIEGAYREFDRVPV